MRGLDQCGWSARAAAYRAVDYERLVAMHLVTSSESRLNSNNPGRPAGMARQSARHTCSASASASAWASGMARAAASRSMSVAMAWIAPWECQGVSGRSGCRAAADRRTGQRRWRQAAGGRERRASDGRRTSRGGSVALAAVARRCWVLSLHEWGRKNGAGYDEQHCGKKARRLAARTAGRRRPTAAATAACWPPAPRSTHGCELGDAPCVWLCPKGAGGGRSNAVWRCVRGKEVGGSQLEPVRASAATQTTRQAPSAGPHLLPGRLRSLEAAVQALDRPGTPETIGEGWQAGRTSAGEAAAARRSCRAPSSMQLRRREAVGRTEIVDHTLHPTCPCRALHR